MAATGESEAAVRAREMLASSRLRFNPTGQFRMGLLKLTGAFPVPRNFHLRRVRPGLRPPPSKRDRQGSEPLADPW